MSSTKHLKRAHRPEWLRNLRIRYYLVLCHEASLEEVWRVVVNFRTILLAVVLICLLLVLGSVTLCMFTPLRRLAPGYTDPTLREDLMFSALRLDSLEREIDVRDRYFEVLRSITTGQDSGVLVQEDSLDYTGKSLDRHLMDFTDDVSFAASHADSLFRAQIETEEQMSFDGVKQILSKLDFAVPAPGTVMVPFDLEQQRLGVDVRLLEQEVASTLDGTVMLALQLPSDTCLVQVQHDMSLVSSYRMPGTACVHAGDRVHAGGVLIRTAVRQPVLHFEIWYRGDAVNPEDYISIE